MAWFSDINIHEARKIHSCAWCGGHIKTGEHYAKYVCTYDGFQVVKLHTECLAASERYDEEEWYPFAPRGLTEAEREEFSECEICERWEYIEHIADGLCRECRAQNATEA